METPSEVAARSHGNQRRLRPLHPLEDPVGGIGAGVQLRNSDIEGPDLGVQLAVPVLVTLGQTIRARLTPLSAGYGAGVLREQRVLIMVCNRLRMSPGDALARASVNRRARSRM